MKRMIEKTIAAVMLVCAASGALADLPVLDSNNSLLGFWPRISTEIRTSGAYKFDNYTSEGEGGFTVSDGVATLLQKGLYFETIDGSNWSGSDIGITIMVNYSNYEPVANVSKTFIATFLKSVHESGIGVYGADTLANGIWSGAVWTGGTGTTLANSGTMFLEYAYNKANKEGNGTYVYNVAADGAASTVFYATGLRSNQEVGKRVNIGCTCPYVNVHDTGLVNANLHVHSVAIFKKTLTAAERIEFARTRKMDVSETCTFDGTTGITDLGGATATWSAGTNLCINVSSTAPDTVTLTLPDGGLNAGSLLHIQVASGKTLVLSGTVTATNIIITGAGVVKVTDKAALSGAVKGDGTLLYQYSSAALPTGATFTDSAWTGTLWLKGFNAGAINPANFAGANSTLRLTGVTGFCSHSTTCQGTLELQDDGDTKAFTLSDGWSTNNPTVFNKLKGSGTLTNSKKTVYQRYVFKDASEFTGTINIVAGTGDLGTDQNRPFRIILGDGASLDPGQGTITIASGAEVTVAAGKTWTAPGGMVVNGSLVVDSGATVPAIADGSTGTIQVVGGSSLNLGNARPTIAGFGAGGTLAVSPNATVAERILGYTPTETLTVTGAINGTVTLNGEVVVPAIEGTTATLTGTIPVAAEPTYAGKSWWWDYEFNGNGNNIGSEGSPLKWDDDRAYKDNEYTTADSAGNRMLHLPARPWRDVSAYPTEFTAVMFCKAGATADGILVSFGSTTHGSCKTITLTTGGNPSAGQMRLIYGEGTGRATDLVENGFTLDNITSANHLYAFTVRTVNDVSQITVYADGELLTTYEADSVISLGTGFQIASAHGGLGNNTVLSGTISRLANTDAATMDFLRVSNVALSEATIKALAAEYRYVSPNGIAERTLSANTNWSEGTSWEQKTLNQDGSSTTTAQAAPNSGTVVEVTASTNVQLTMNLASEVSYEKLTFQGDGAITVKAGTGAVAPTVTTRTYINTDVTMDIDAFASLGATTIADGKTLTVVPNQTSVLSTAIGLGVRGTASSIVTGTVTLGTGSNVVLPTKMVSDFAAYGFALTLEKDASNRYVFTITRADNPVYITKAPGGTVTYAMYPDGLPPYATAGLTLPAEPESIPADFPYVVTIVNNNESEPLEVSTTFNGGKVKIGSGSNPINFTGGRVEFDASNGDTLNLTGCTVATRGGDIVFPTGITVVCDAANTLQGTVKGTNVTIRYPEGVLPDVTTDFAKAIFTDEAWAGTLVITNCGHLASEPAGERVRVPFEKYGSVNSKIKAPGFNGFAAVAEGYDDICNATLIIDSGTTFEFNHGFEDTDIYTVDQNARFKFKKLSGSGLLKLDGTTDFAQYIFCDVSEFTGNVHITFPGEGGRKSYLFGADEDWDVIGSAYPANLAIMGSVTNNNSTWTIPAGVVINAGGELVLRDGATITALSPNSRGTLVVPSGTATIGGVTNSVIKSALDIAAGATLYISDTTITELTIPAEAGTTYKNAGTLNLSDCKSLETLYLELGASTSFNFTNVSLPASCTKVFYVIGESDRDANTYSATGTYPGVINYLASETVMEYRDGVFEMTNVPTGAQVFVVRRNGATIEAKAPEGDATKRTYDKGATFSGAACLHEWDFEQTTGTQGFEDKLNDSGKHIGTASAVTLATDQTPASSDYITIPLGSEPKVGLSSALHPHAAISMSGNWSAAVRCTMPSNEGKQIAVTFGDTDSGILGLAYDNNNTADTVELFDWNGGVYTTLAKLQVESAKEAQHIYVVAVTNVTENATTKQYASFYRDGEFIHTAEFASPTSITNFCVGAAVVGTAARTGLPADATTGGCVDYVRLYDKTLDATIAEGLSARRPFVSQYETYVRNVNGNEIWSASDAWVSKSDGTRVSTPGANTHVTLLAESQSTMTINLENNVTYNTLIFARAADAAVEAPITVGSSDKGTISAGMIVVRTPVTVNYGAVNFPGAKVGVDAGASLTFNFADYPFDSVKEETKVYVTGVVVAREYDATVDSRILAIGQPVPAICTLSHPTYDAEKERYYVTITPDHTPGSDVYYKRGYWSSRESSFAVTNASGAVTTVFDRDTVVIPSYIDDKDNATSAYFDSELPANVAKIRVEKDYTFESGVKNAAILGGVEVTVASGKTLSFGATWNALKLGAVTLKGPGAVRFGENAEAASIAGDAAITVASGKTLTLDTNSADFTGSFSGEGTVKLLSVAGDGLDVSHYGNNGWGTLAIGSMNNYLKNPGSQTVSITSALRLDGNATISALSADWTYTIAKLAGTGNFNIPAGATSGKFTISNIQDYTGTLNTASNVAVSRITLANDVAGGTKILTRSGEGTITVSKVYVGNTEQNWPVAYDAEGVYKASASIGNVAYRYIADAITAAGENLGAINVWDTSVEMPVGYEINNSSVVKTASTFVWNSDVAGAWNTAANWRVGGEVPARLPASVDTVSFARAASVTVPGNVTVGTISCNNSVALTGSSVTLTATTIELTALGASISVNGVTLSPTPTTPVSGATVRAVTENNVTTYTAVNANVARVGATEYATLAAAITAAAEDDVVVLLNNVEIDLTREGETFDKAVTIDGNNWQYTITFNLKGTNNNGAYSKVNTANDAKLVLQNINLTNTQVGEGLTVPNHNIAFNCPVELKNVISDKALAFYKDATLDGVVVAEKEDAYAIWIHTSATDVSIKDLTVNTTTGRGIKVSDVFLDGATAAESTALSLDGATFKTKNAKAAVLVGATQNGHNTATVITATGKIDISGVPADTTNLVWVDEACADTFGTVSLDTTGATGISSVIGTEPVSGDYAATLSTGDKIDGYYKQLNTKGKVKGAIDEASATQKITLLKDAESATVARAITVALNGKTLSASTLSAADASITVLGGTLSPVPGTTVDYGVVMTTRAGDDTKYWVAIKTPAGTDQGANVYDIIPPAEVEEIDVSVVISETDKVAVPATVKKITGVTADKLLLKVEYDDNGTPQTANYAGILSLDGSGNISLNPSGTVEGVTVKPEIRTGADTEPMTLDSDALGFTVKTIPGLYYSAESCSTPNGTFTSASEPRQATTASTVIETDEDMGMDTVKYYRIKVGTTPND